MSTHGLWSSCRHGALTPSDGAVLRPRYPIKLAGFWTAQSLWGWIVLLPVTVSQVCFTVVIAMSMNALKCTSLLIEICFGGADFEPCSPDWPAGVSCSGWLCLRLCHGDHCRPSGKYVHGWFSSRDAVSSCGPPPRLACWCLQKFYFKSEHPDR